MKRFIVFIFIIFFSERLMAQKNIGFPLVSFTLKDTFHHVSFLVYQNNVTFGFKNFKLKNDDNYMISICRIENGVLKPVFECAEMELTSMEDNFQSLTSHNTVSEINPYKLKDNELFILYIYNDKSIILSHPITVQDYRTLHDYIQSEKAYVRKNYK